MKLGFSFGVIIRHVTSGLLMAISLGVTVNHPVDATAASCTQPPPGLVAWWSGEVNSQDNLGASHGIASSGISYTTGEVGESFLLDNTNSYFHAAASPSLNVGAGDGFTIEAWIKPANVNGLHPIVEWNNGTGGIGVQLWLGPSPWSQGSLCAYIMDTNGNNYLQVPSPSGALVTNVWQHVATTYDRASHQVKVYINGSVVAQSTWAGDVPQTGYDFWVGTRPEDCYGCWTYGTVLGGPLDELSLYNRALTTNELKAIYDAGSAGKCQPTVVDCTPPPTGLVGWWQGENSANDTVSSINGTLLGNAGYATGKVGLGFAFTNFGD